MHRHLSHAVLALAALAALLGSGGTTRTAAAPEGGVPAPTLLSAAPGESPVGPAGVYSALRLAFEANRGQTDAGVDYLARGPGYALFLTPAEAVLALRPPDAVAPAARAPRPTPGAAPGVVDGAVLRLRLIGAQEDAVAEGLDPLPGTANYLLGNDPAAWRTGVPTYARVAYRGVYPGVDLLYYGAPGGLEYDLVVAPGADPATVRLSIEGADAGGLDAAGDLVLRLAGGEVRQRRPVLYQEADGVRHEVAGGYLLGEGPGGLDVTFWVGAYDPARTLMIDPVLAYSTYLGGAGIDYGTSVAVDAAGSAYVTGLTQSSDFPTARPFLPSLRGREDAFVVKLDPTGSVVLYATYLGGSDSDWGQDLAVDAAGNAYVSGTTVSPDFPTTGGAFQRTYRGGQGDVFVTKLNPSGAALVYSTFLGGRGSEIGGGLALDAAGSAYVTGHTGSPDFPTVNPLQPALRGDYNAFVAKLAPAGTALVYATYLGGGQAEEGRDIVVDAAGSAYVTGWTQSTDFPTVGARQPTFGGWRDAFVAKLTPAGTVLAYATYLGGSSFEEGNGIAVDAGGRAHVIGVTQSADFPTANALQPTLRGPVAAFVAKLGPTGATPVYATYLSSQGGEWGFGIAVDAAGDAYVTGSTASAAFPTTADAFQRTYRGAPSNYYGDAFVARLNQAGTALVYSTFLGGSGRELGTAIAVHGAGDVYVTGQTLSPDFPVRNAPQATYGGDPSGFYGDAFVVKLAATPPGPALCFGRVPTLTGAGPIVGTAGDDVILGSSGADQILGGAGNDLICGGEGNDVLDGGAGDDRLDGGPGRDVLLGGSGDDVLLGDSGDDVLDGGPGEDTCAGGAGTDAVIACEAVRDVP